MASTSETGHVKNIDNFHKLIALCTTYGATYNPARTHLQLASLNDLYTTARNSMADVNTAKTALINATNARQTAFDPLRKLCTRIINALDASEASQKLVEDAKTINRKIQGARSTPKPLPQSEASQDKTISASQQSYGSLAANFAKLIEILENEPAYTPNEADLQVAHLQQYHNTLMQTNIEVDNAYANYTNARIARNNILYTPGSGLVDTALDAKKYIKSVYGTDSLQYKHINKINFKNRKE